MSVSKSRLGKGLGALFPALPGEDALVDSSIKLQDSVSHETSSENDLQKRNSLEKQSKNTEHVSRETVKKDSNSEKSVSHETKVPSMKNSISPHANVDNNKIKNVSRETVPSLQGSKQGEKHVGKHAHKRSAMPSLGDVTRPIDFFFSDSTSPNFKLDKQKNAESNNLEKGAENQQLKPIKGGYLDYLKPLDIVPNAHQPRTIFDEDELRELASSIKEVGVLQPIVVRPIKDADKNNKEIAHYELIMGERRWRASQIAQLDTVPAIVRTTADENMLRDALLENLHRVALNPLEEAAAYSQMIDDFGLTQIQLSKSVSKSRPQIANTLRLLNLPASVQKHVASGVLSAGHARALLGLEKPEDMEELANRIISEGLSVRSTEEIVSLKTEHPANGVTRTRARRNNYWSSSPIRQQLEERFATKVAIKGTQNHGRIEIVFSSPEEMKRIINLLSH
ncbi:ParB/RepB/Spo0J family partition protein [Gardnerella greenwoodii]|uniref:ParB/RepB/Spo0J family partition protein n=1 Tax=Gardnerella greenwoodii TaxID=2914925 RepID=UPI0039F1177C